MAPFDFHFRGRLIFAPGALARLGEIASQLGFRRALLVTDRGLAAAGLLSRDRKGAVEEAVRVLAAAGVAVEPFHDFDANPDTAMVEAGRDFAASRQIDSLIGLGGGSSLDCAKGINFLLTNGGTMQDYRGYGKAARPLLPMIGIPTTTGTGSEAQSYALISDGRTRAKMACGDPTAAFRAVILDPCLTITQPFAVRAAAGFDALAHAVETHVTTRRNGLSECYSREAWRLIESHYERALADPEDLETMAALQWGAYLAGAAIENSMLGAAHACANPLTQRYGTAHGLALSALLPHVVRWNGVAAGARYGELLRLAGRDLNGMSPAEGLARRLEQLAAAGRLPVTLSALGVPDQDLPVLAREAAGQWTGGFNPRPWSAEAALEVYRCAY